MSEIPIPPAVTLYWQEERIKELEAQLELAKAEAQDVRERWIPKHDRLRAALEKYADESWNKGRTSLAREALAGAAAEK